MLSHTLFAVVDFCGLCVFLFELVIFPTIIDSPDFTIALLEPCGGELLRSFVVFSSLSLFNLVTVVNGTMLRARLANKCNQCEERFH